MNENFQRCFSTRVQPATCTETNSERNNKHRRNPLVCCFFSLNDFAAPTVIMFRLCDRLTISDHLTIGHRGGCHETKNLEKKSSEQKKRVQNRVSECHAKDIAKPNENNRKAASYLIRYERLSNSVHIRENFRDFSLFTDIYFTRRDLSRLLR